MDITNDMNNNLSEHLDVSKILFDEELMKEFKDTLQDLLAQIPYPHNVRLTDFISHNSGKMIRPLIVIQSAKLLGANEPQLHRAFITGSVIEMLHNASLIHDDLLDGSPKRRSSETYHEKHGKNMAISDADLLWSYSLTHGKIFEKDLILYLLNEVYTVNKGNSKELEIRMRKDYDFTRDDIIEVMRMKTATVFYACVNGSCIITDHKELGKKLKNCLINAGIAFQLQDDILDVSGGKSFGKQNYWDIQESKPNLFLHYTLQTDHRSKIMEIYSKPVGEKSDDDMKFVIDLFCGVLDKVIDIKNGFMNTALEELNIVTENVTDPTELRFLKMLKAIVIALGNRTK